MNEIENVFGSQRKNILNQFYGYKKLVRSPNQRNDRKYVCTYTNTSESLSLLLFYVINCVSILIYTYYEDNVSTGDDKAP